MNLLARLKCKAFGHNFMYLVRASNYEVRCGYAQVLERQHVIHCTCCRLDIVRRSSFNTPPEPHWM